MYVCVSEREETHRGEEVRKGGGGRVGEKSKIESLRV